MNKTTALSTNVNKKTAFSSINQSHQKREDDLFANRQTKLNKKQEEGEKETGNGKRIPENNGFDYEYDVFSNYSYTGKRKILSLKAEVEETDTQVKRPNIADCLGYDFQIDMYAFSNKLFKNLKSKRMRLDRKETQSKKTKYHLKQQKENKNTKNNTRGKHKTLVIKAKKKNYIIKGRETSKRSQQRKPTTKGVKTGLKDNININNISKVTHTDDFNLQGLREVKKQEYNCLYDKNLQDFFCRSKRKMSHLMKMGLITEDGHIIHITRGGQKIKGKELCNFKELKKSRTKYLQQTYQV